MTIAEKPTGAAAAAPRPRPDPDPDPRRDPSSRPLVTVGLPVFNGENYLARALASILGQDYPNLQLVVADNGSTDRTAEICREFARADGRVDYHRSPVNRGAAWNYNRIVHVAEGPYFKWAAHDDLIAPTFLSRCVEALETMGELAVLAYPRTAVIDVDDQVVGDFEDAMDLWEPIAHERLRHFLTARTEYHPVFGVIRTAELLETPLIGRYAGSDVVLLAQLALRGRFVEVPERLFLRRFHRETSVNANPHAKERAAWFDPKRRRASLPMIEKTTRIAAVVGRQEGLTRVERVRCLGIVGRHLALPHTRHMAGELRAVLWDRRAPSRGRR